MMEHADEKPFKIAYPPADAHVPEEEEAAASTYTHAFPQHHSLMSRLTGSRPISWSTVSPSVVGITTMILIVITAVKPAVLGPAFLTAHPLGLSGIAATLALRDLGFAAAGSSSNEAARTTEVPFVARGRMPIGLGEARVPSLEEPPPPQRRRTAGHLFLISWNTFVCSSDPPGWAWPDRSWGEKPPCASAL